MTVSILPIYPTFAGEVTGIDCSKSLSPDEAAAVEAGMDRHAVLVFRDQPLTDQEQIGFTRHFGELEGYNTPGHIRKKDDSRLGAGIADFSNLDKSGNIMSDQDRVWFFKLGRGSAHARRLSPARRASHGPPRASACRSAPRTHRGAFQPAAPMITKGQVRNIGGDAIRAQATFVTALFQVAA